MDPVLARFRPLTASQRRIGKYFSWSRQSCCCRSSSARSWLTTTRTGRAFMASRSIASSPSTSPGLHIQAPIVWIGLSWIGAALFLAPAISGDEPRGQAFLVDVLFWVTLFIVVGALAALSRHHGVYRRKAGLVRHQGLSYISSSAGHGRSGFRRLAIWSVLVFPRLLANPRHSRSGDGNSGRDASALNTDLGVHR